METNRLFISHLFVLLTTVFLFAPVQATTTKACLVFYKAIPKLPKVTIQSTVVKTWNLEAKLLEDPELVGYDRAFNKILKVPSIWKNFVHRKIDVPYRYTEKTFERKTMDGEKYIVSYHIVEPADGRYRSTIVLQHGFAESSRYFRVMTRILVAMNFRVIGMDGVNAGNTLIHTKKKFKDHLHAPSPAEDGFALADVLRLEIPENEKFILFGHSRGFAISSITLATGLFDDQLIAHVGSNGYDVWKIDSIVDELTRNPFKMLFGWGIFSEFFFNQMRGILRYQSNLTSEKILKRALNQHNINKSDESLGEITRKYLTDVTMEIGKGLAGKDTSKPGFATTPLFDVNISIEDSDNVGLTSKKAPYKINHLSQKVKDKTTLVLSKDDKLITEISAAPIIAEVPNKPIIFEKDEELGIEATHFIPSERPFDLVGVVLNLFKSREK